MATATTATTPASSHIAEKMKKGPGRIGTLVFGLVLIGGLVFIGTSISHDLTDVVLGSAWPYILLGLALLVALGFEFVNGFHDTANAVATVIYTHSFDPNIAVVWSGFWNFLGVVTSTGAVAFGIVSLLPVELILQVGGNGGFAMVFALLIAAIVWNLGTWWFGLPASSSHTMIGSIIGVGIANQLMSTKTGTSGVDWAQAANIGKSLLLSPIFGFLLASLLFVVMKAVIKDKRLYESPQGDRASAILDSRHAHSDVHWCELLPRLKRRAKRYGPDHADSDWNRADHVRVEPCSNRTPVRRISLLSPGKRRTPLANTWKAPR